MLSVIVRRLAVACLNVWVLSVIVRRLAVACLNVSVLSVIVRRLAVACLNCLGVVCYCEASCSGVS